MTNETKGEKERMLAVRIGDLNEVVDAIMKVVETTAPSYAERFGVTPSPKMEDEATPERAKGYVGQIELLTSRLRLAHDGLVRLMKQLDEVA